MLHKTKVSLLFTISYFLFQLLPQYKSPLKLSSLQPEQSFILLRILQLWQSTAREAHLGCMHQNLQLEDLLLKRFTHIGLEFFILPSMGLHVAQPALKHCDWILRVCIPRERAIESSLIGHMAFFLLLSIHCGCHQCLKSVDSLYLLKGSGKILEELIQWEILLWPFL